MCSPAQSFPAIIPLISAKGMASLAKVKVPCSLISRAARRKAPSAARDSAEPRLMRRTPAAANSATENGRDAASTFTGFETEPQTVLIASSDGKPGA